MTKKRPVISENSAFASVVAARAADTQPMWGASRHLSEGTRARARLETLRRTSEQPTVERG